MKTALTSAVLLCASAFALAQAIDPLGRVTQARGVVTVSDGQSVGLAEQGTPFFDGTRFVSSPSGNAELTLDNGCIVRLKPNESIVIRGKVSCEDLLAMVQPVPGAPVVAGAGLGPSELAAIGGVLLLAAKDSRSTSSSTPISGGGTPIIPGPVTPE